MILEESNFKSIARRVHLMKSCNRNIIAQKPQLKQNRTTNSRTQTHKSQCTNREIDTFRMKHPAVANAVSAVKM